MDKSVDNFAISVDKSAKPVDKFLGLKKLQLIFYKILKTRILRFIYMILINIIKLFTQKTRNEYSSNKVIHLSTEVIHKHFSSK